MIAKGFSTLGCPELGLPEALNLAARHHMGAIELRTLAGTLDLPAYFTTNYGHPDVLAEAVRRQPVRIVALDTSLRLADGSPADRAQFLEFIPWAEAVGAQWLRVFDGGSEREPDSIAAAARGWSWWREQRRAHGWKVDMMVETHDSLFSADAVALLRQAAPDVRLLWDAHNTWRRGSHDLPAMWSAIKPAVVHVHIKDSVSRPVLQFPYTYVLPGDGEFPARELLAALERDGFTGVVSLEWERQWHPYLPPLEDALAAAEQRHWW